MELNEVRSIIEALVFVSEEPITKRGLLEIFEGSSVTDEMISQALDSIKESFEAQGGIELAQVAGGFQFRTKESCAQWIHKLSIPKAVRLTQPSLETLAIIAYRQPIVRSEIEAIRGVDVGGVLRTLLERNLIRIIGKRDEPGQPLIYATTQEFLATFSLSNLNALPPLADIEDLAKRRVETEQLPAADGDEPQEVMEGDRNDEESGEDRAVMASIEQGLKNLKRLEKEMFPKEEAAQGAEVGAVSSAEEKTEEV